MASPSAGAPALKYGDVNTETTSPGEVKGLRLNIFYDKEIDWTGLDAKIFSENELLRCVKIRNISLHKFWDYIIINISKQNPKFYP